MQGAASTFARAEVLIRRGENLESFMPVLRADNAGIKPTVECILETVDYLRDRIAPALFEAHWQEVAQDKSWEPEPNWPYYRQLEIANMLRIVVLKVNHQPVGYFIFIVSESLHYRSHRLASSDMFYIMPQHRAQYAVRLFRAAEAAAREASAGKMYIAFKIYKDIAPLTKRLGFKHIEDVVVKSLE